MYAIYAYIGVVLGVNVGIYGSPIECLGTKDSELSSIDLCGTKPSNYTKADLNLNSTFNTLLLIFLEHTRTIDSSRNKCLASSNRCLTSNNVCY